jgi:hypothetical protein
MRSAREQKESSYGNQIRAILPGTVSHQAFRHVVSLTISDPDVRNGYEEALLLYYSDCRIRTDLDLLDAIKGMLTEIAEEGHLTELVLIHNTWFILCMLRLGK